jgi:uncharacterized SAM-binding protein YcdF (DUF218 family)
VLVVSFLGAVLRRFAFILVLLVCVAAGAYAGRHVWLPELALFLIESHPPEKAEIIVVLAGDGYGRRILRAAELVEQGHAPRVLVNGAAEFYGLNESQAAIEFAVQRGAPRRVFDAFPNEAKSTIEEAKIVDDELARRGVSKALVVTSDFHTRRSRSLFEARGSGKVRYVFVAAPHPEFDPEAWWQSRQGVKTLFLEYLKTFYTWFELSFGS